MPDYEHVGSICVTTSDARYDLGCAFSMQWHCAQHTAQLYGLIRATWDTYTLRSGRCIQYTSPVTSREIFPIENNNAKCKKFV